MNGIVLSSKNKHAELLVKQIAGALAKRIVNYLELGQEVQQSEEMVL